MHHCYLRLCAINFKGGEGEVNIKGFLLFAIAIVTIGIFVLPITVSLFAGQHSWYDLSAGPSDVPCEKCHADISDEMQSGESGAHGNLTCAMCHRSLFTGYEYARVQREYFVGPQGTIPGNESHAASTVKCMNCHGLYRAGTSGDFPENHCKDPEHAGNCMKCHWAGWYDFISAGGFGLEDPTGRNPGHNSTDTDTGEYAAHRQFVLDAMENNTLEGANEACIACHTKMPVKIGFNVTTGAKIIVNNSYSQSHSYWDVESITPGNYTTYEEEKE